MDSHALSIDTRHTLNKTHGILMVLAWLLFVPTAYLFVRILRSERFGQKRWLGSPTWFQVHRALTVASIVCVAASLLCIAISQGWKWKGPGSGSKFWTEMHTLIGLISSVLCFFQGIIALVRCEPTHRMRPLFNWTHRIVGIVSFILGVTTICIAAIHFLKIWAWPTTEFVLSLISPVLCLIFTLFYSRGQKVNIGNKLGSNEALRVEDKVELRSNKFAQILREHRSNLVLGSVGIFALISLALSIFIANGYPKK